MPNIRSAKKRMRSDAKKQARNKAATSELDNLHKKLRTLSGKPAEAKTLAALLISRYDRAVSRGVIPRGRADRKKSRIARFLVHLKK